MNKWQKTINKLVNTERDMRAIVGFRESRIELRKVVKAEKYSVKMLNEMRKHLAYRYEMQDMAKVIMNNPYEPK